MKLELQVKNVQLFHYAPRRTSFFEKAQLQKIIDDLISVKIIWSSVSEFVSPILLVKKKKKTRNSRLSAYV